MHGRSTAERIRSKTFPLGLRGYDREAVHSWLDEVADLVERLEEQPPSRETAVKRALDEIGQETAAILQRAHDAAEEIEARSRAQADGRLERAEREAEQTVAEAEERLARLEADTRRIWDQRERLLEEMRQLADEVLGVADDAIERMRPPADEAAEAEEAGERPAFEAVSELREELEAADAEEPTVEVEISRLEPEPNTEEVPEPDDGEPPDVPADDTGGEPGSGAGAGPQTDPTRA